MKKSLFIFLTGLLLLALFVGSASAMGGSGTQADPWTINSLADLKLLSGTGYASYVGADKYFILTSDIVNDGSLQPIGNSTYLFNGHLNGQNHSISNLSDVFMISRDAFIHNIEIKNFNLQNKNCLFQGTYNTVHDININDSTLDFGSYLGSTYLFDSITTELYNFNIRNVYLHSYGQYSGGALVMHKAPVNIRNGIIENCCAYCKGGTTSLLASSDNNGTILIENCKAINSFASGYYSASALGITGYDTMNVTFSNCSVKNCTIISTSNSPSYTGDVSVSGFVVGNTTYSFSIYFNACSCENTILISNFTHNSGFFAPITNNKASANGTNCVLKDVSFNSFNYVTFGFSGSGNVTSGIESNISSYLYLSSPSFINDTSQESPKAIGETVTFTLNGLRGAAIYIDNNKVQSGYSFNYDEGGMMVGNNPFTAKYSTEGIKTVWCSLTGWDGSSSVYVASIYTLAYIKVPLLLTNFTTNPPSSSYSPTNVSVSLTALTSGGTPTSYVWSYTTDPNPSASSSWENIGTTSSNTTTFTPTTVGTYTFRVVASMTGASVDSLDVPLKPYLQIFVSLSGDGTSSNPYKVGSDADLQNWSTYNTYYNDKYMSITQDFVPTVTVNKFEGHLEGNNHVLSQGQKSLFYTLNAIVQNLTLSKFINKGYYGILSEYGSASVSNVTVEESYVQRSNIVGGIIGRANGSTFTNCTVNHVTIRATASNGIAGGITGEGNVTVTNCRVLNSDILAATSYGVCP